MPATLSEVCAETLSSHVLFFVTTCFFLSTTNIGLAITFFVFLTAFSGFATAASFFATTCFLLMTTNLGFATTFFIFVTIFFGRVTTASFFVATSFVIVPSCSDP